MPAEFGARRPVMDGRRPDEKAPVRWADVLQLVHSRGRRFEVFLPDSLAELVLSYLDGFCAWAAELARGSPIKKNGVPRASSDRPRPLFELTAGRGSGDTRYDSLSLPCPGCFAVSYGSEACRLADSLRHAAVCAAAAEARVPGLPPLADLHALGADGRLKSRLPSSLLTPVASDGPVPGSVPGAAGMRGRASGPVRPTRRGAPR